MHARAVTRDAHEAFDELHQLLAESQASQAVLLGCCDVYRAEVANLEADPMPRSSRAPMIMATYRVGGTWGARRLT